MGCTVADMSRLRVRKPKDIYVLQNSAAFADGKKFSFTGGYVWLQVWHINEAYFWQWCGSGSPFIYCSWYREQNTLTEKTFP